MCVSFSSAIGTPQVALTIGNRTRYASFSSLQGQHTHDRYRVQSGDLDTDGITIAAEALTLSGGSIVAPGNGLSRSHCSVLRTPRS